VGNPLAKPHLKDREDNIKIDLMEVGTEDGKWMALALLSVSSDTLPGSPVTVFVRTFACYFFL
jgi:hypothetical protein